MNKIIIGFGAFSLTMILFSCKQKKDISQDQNNLHFDTTSLVIFRWDTALYEFPKNSDPISLTQDDFVVIDSLFGNALDSFNHTFPQRLSQSFGGHVPLDSFVIKREKYRFQYFPYKDVNGQRIVNLVCFDLQFPDWKSIPYLGRDHNGMHRLEFRVNLSEKTDNGIRIGGFG